ncbi:MAG TPA: response regulator transcription factor [Anaerolineales bacterium]|nr:response regulator transcription factor [Anaerolineales bacterium]
MRILVADDHSLFRDGLTSLLKASGFEIAGEVGNGEQAVRETLRLKPDIVLMDLNMPDMNGLQALRQIRAMAPSTKVVMLTVSDRTEDLVEAIESGAYGYLLKTLDSQSFIASMRGLEEGKAPISGEMTSHLLAHIAQQAGSANVVSGSKPVLSDREIDILRLIAHGMRNRAIAEELKISENTVKYHLKHIMQKLHLKNRAEAAAYSVESGLANPDKKK